MCIITLDYNNPAFKELFNYSENVESSLIWKIDNKSFGTSKRYAGDMAGSYRITCKETNTGAWYVKFEGKAYAVHRVVWYLNFGNLSHELVVDHIDGNARNNTIKNLRAVTQIINNRNHQLQSNNISGVTGVYFEEGLNRWKAQYNDPITGKAKTKSFAVLKYGNETAKQLATEFRKANLDSSYSDRHGV